MVADTVSLGEFLRQEREKRGVTIEQVASATKIGVRMLYSIEADQYADLPAKPFIRGFVTSYARFIGLDPKEILTRFGDFVDSKALDRPMRDAGHSGYAFEKREGEQSRTLLWFIMGGFILLGGLVIFVFKPSLKHRNHGHVERLRAVSSPSPIASPSPSPSPFVSSLPVPVAVATSPSPSPTTAPKPDPLNSGLDLEPAQVRHRVVFRALADVWVRYQSDSRPVMKFLLRKDKVLVLRAQEIIRIQVSNPASVTYEYGSRGRRPFVGDKNLTTYLSTSSLVFPPELVEKIKESFIGEGPLPNTPDPSQPAASTSPTPAE